MRIGIAISSLDGGGAEHIVRLWAHALARLDQEVLLYGYSPEAKSDNLEKLGLAGFPYQVFPGQGRIARAVGLPPWLRYVVKRDELDVLFCQLPYTNLAALLGLRTLRPSATPLYICEHNVPTLLFAGAGVGAQVQRRLAQVLYRRSDGVIAVSHATATDLMCSYDVPRDRVFVLPNAVFPAFTDPTTRACPSRSDPLTVLFVGRVTQQKQPDVFVRTLAELQRRLPNREVRGVVIGTGPLERQMKETAQAHHVHLEFTGWVPDWVSTASKFNPSCILLASHIEGFGNVLVEAAAAGIPAVASSTALGVSDAILPGLTGQLAMSSLPTHLADAVTSAAETPIKATAIAPWLERFTADAVAARLLAILGGELHNRR